MTATTRVFETNQFYLKPLLNPTVYMNKSLFLGWCSRGWSCCLLCWLLLGFQHLGLDLWTEAARLRFTIVIQTRMQGFAYQLVKATYSRVVQEDGMTSCSLGIGVQFQHHPQVLQRVLL